MLYQGKGFPQTTLTLRTCHAIHSDTFYSFPICSVLVPSMLVRLTKLISQLKVWRKHCIPPRCLIYIPSSCWELSFCDHGEGFAQKSQARTVYIHLRNSRIFCFTDWLGWQPETQEPKCYPSGIFQLIQVLTSPPLSSCVWSQPGTQAPANLERTRKQWEMMKYSSVCKTVSFVPHWCLLSPS